MQETSGPRTGYSDCEGIGDASVKLGDEQMRVQAGSRDIEKGVVRRYVLGQRVRVELVLVICAYLPDSEAISASLNRPGGCLDMIRLVCSSLSTYQE